MSANKEVAINTTSSMICQVVTLVINLILPRMYLLKFGSEINGLVSSITQFISYFTIIEAGLSTTTVNALYLPMARRNIPEINGILTAAKNFYNQIGIIFSVLVVMFSVIYPFIIETELLSYAEIAILVCVLGISGALDFFTLSKYRPLLTADKKYYTIANSTSIATIINFVVIYITLSVSESIIVVRMAALTMYVFRSAFLAIYVRRHYKFVDYSVVPEKEALSKRSDAMVLQILGLVQNATPIVFITLFVKDLRLVSVWSIYNMVASQAINLLFSFSNGYAASLGELYAKNDNRTLNLLFKNYETLFFIIISWCYSCMFILYQPFVGVYTSNITDVEYVSFSLSLFFVLNGLLYNFKTPVGTLIGVAGVYRETKKATLIQAVIAIVVGLVATPFWGLYGILMGLILSNLYRDIDLINFMYERVLKSPKKHSYFRCFVALLSVLCSASIFIPFQMKVYSFIEFIIYSLLIAIACIVVVIVTWVVFRYDDIKSLMRTVFRGNRK